MLNKEVLSDIKVFLGELPQLFEASYCVQNTSELLRAYVFVLSSEDTEKPRHAKLLESDSLATAAMHMCLHDQLRDNYERYYMEASRATMFVWVGFCCTSVTAAALPPQDHALRPRTGVVLDFHGLKEKLGSQGSQGAEAEETEDPHATAKETSAA